MPVLCCFSDTALGTTRVTKDDLRFFETVEEITGYFIFEPEQFLDLENLMAFKNLRRIGGTELLS